MSYRELYRVDGLPVFQNKMYATREAALSSPTGNMVLVQQDDTGLIHNVAFDPSLLTYDTDYQNEQAHSAIFQHHLDDVCAIMARRFSGRSIIEVGCGKGYFLELLQRQGYRITGIDPAYEGTNPDIVAASFEPSLGINADVLVLRHSLEHIPNPLDFLGSLVSANGGGGLIYIEVPCFEWICRHRAWFDIFYEHVNYFRLCDFERMFGRIIESGYLFGRQYLYVIADLATLRKPVATARDRLAFPADFLGGVERFAEKIKADPDGGRAIWGGASKGVIFALYMQNRGANIDLVIDINPAKQGKYIAATGVQVRSPREALDILSPGSRIFVMNSNYFEEIVQQSHNRYHYTRVDRYEF